MSSVTTCTTVASRAQPSWAAFGLNNRTTGRPGTRCRASSTCDLTAPTRSVGSSPMISSAGTSR